MATYSNNTTIKIKGAASGGYVLQVGEYAEVSYTPNPTSTFPISSGLVLSLAIYNVTYGAGQTISNTISVKVGMDANDAGGFASISCTLISGTVFINTP